MSVQDIKKLSLHTGQVVHQAGAYPGFCSMRRLGVFLLPHGWDASPPGGYSGLQATRMIEGIFLGLKFFIPGYFLGTKIWQVFFWG